MIHTASEPSTSLSSAFHNVPLVPAPAAHNVKENGVTLAQLILFLFLRSLVKSTSYHIKLLQTFVNNLLFSFRLTESNTVF